MSKSQKTFASLFVLSIFVILFGEDGMIKYFSIERFGIPFIFISLPFMLAYYLGWKKGFGFSILTSGVTLLTVTIRIGFGASEGWIFLYNTFFALFSLWYLTLSALIVFIVDSKSKKIFVYVVGGLILACMFTYIMLEIRNYTYGLNPY